MNTIANTIEQVALFHRVNGDDEVAALIAAAPDLLAALENVASALTAQRKAGVEHGPNLTSAFYEAVAHIQRARGEG